MAKLVEPSHGLLPIEQRSNGCFETMRVYGGRIFRLESHLDRLYASAQYLGTRAPADRPHFRQQLVQALERSRLQEAILRVALLPQKGAEASPSIVVQPVRLPTAAAYRLGIRVAVVPARKFPVSTIDNHAKYSARLASVLAVMEAQLRGVDEALWMDAMGFVTESTASNFGVIRQGAILTPPCSLGLLAGITRDVLFELAQVLRLPIRATPLTRHEIYNADEAFLTSTIKEVLAVTMVDGRRIGTGRPGPVTKRLRLAFQRLVKKEMDGHR